MGTVHAKADDNPLGELASLFDLDPPEPKVKTAIELKKIKARVDRVHVDGLKRTKDDIIKHTINDMFLATDFEDVIVKAHNVRSKLEALGCFRDVGVFVDVSSMTKEGLEVTFNVREVARVVGGMNTTVSENEGNLVAGIKLPNLQGRGERLSVEYSMGYRSSSNFSLTASKPYVTKPLTPLLSASLFQQQHKYPWSGYRLLDRGVLFDIAFKTSPTTKHNLQWEGLVRETSVLNKSTSFFVRENSGPQLKSCVRHIVEVDHRDDGTFPTRGTHVKLSSELAGLGGGAALLRLEAHAQANKKLLQKVVFQVSGSAGVMQEVCGAGLADRFYLGGATTLRGFAQGGAGPHADQLATGGRAYYAGAAHVFAPLPYLSGGLAELLRAHAFITAGTLLGPDQSFGGLSWWASSMRMSAGIGIALRLSGGARLELSYCRPLRALPDDRTAPGLVLGLGAHCL